QLVVITNTIFGRTFPQQLFWNNCLINQGLVHRKNIRCFLWLIGTEASWRMKHTWRNIPACTWNQRECLRIHGDFVVPFGEVLQAFFDLLFGGTRSDAEESIGEISAVIVQLWGVVVSLWFSFLPYFGRLLIIVVDVMWQWSQIHKDTQYLSDISTFKRRGKTPCQI